MRRHLIALLVAALAVLALFHRDALHLMAQWNSSTFAHCWLIPPIIGWLVWTRRAAVTAIAPRAWWPGLLWVGAGAIAWLLGEAASVALFRHAGLVLMLQGLVPTLLGFQSARALAFPLFYALFLIPFGEELIAPMQLITADMAMLLLRLSGIPASLDGIFITTPGGHFAVAEACSGVKFLVAMAALSVLAAHLLFRGWRRRALFILFALTVPVLANGVRAYGTIWMAERWGTDLAVGADHLIYGWLFFAAVMALIGWAASPWFDRDPIEGDGVPVPYQRPAAQRSLPLAPAALLALALAAAPLAWVQAASHAAPLASIAVPAIDGWRLVERDAAAPWRARFDGADRRIDAVLSDGRGAPVTLTLVGYARQGEGREIVGFGQGAVDPDSSWKWGRGLAAIGAARVDRIADADAVRDVLSVYVVGGRVTSDARAVKWRTLVARLGGGDQRAYALLLSAPAIADVSGRERIARLVDAGGGVEALARRLTGNP